MVAHTDTTALRHTQRLYNFLKTICGIEILFYNIVLFNILFLFDALSYDICLSGTASAPARSGQNDTLQKLAHAHNSQQAANDIPIA